MRRDSGEAATKGSARSRGRPPRPDRRRDVLRTAARVFGREGFRQATLLDIARELDLTRAALYYYAESKDELLAQCRDVAREQFEAALEAAGEASTGLAQIRRWFVSYAEITCDDFGRCFVLTDPSEMTLEEGERNRASQRRMASAVAKMVQRGIADGSVRRCNPTRASQALFAIFNGLSRWYRASHRSTPAQLAEEYLELFFQGLRADA